LNASFKQADIRPVKAALQRQLFLRKPALSANFSESLTEGALWAGLGMNVAAALLCQQPYPAILTTIVPRIIVRM
jgi:hypothetical protein